jgi:hypothetical protein
MVRANIVRIQMAKTFFISHSSKKAVHAMRAMKKVLDRDLQRPSPTIA